MNMLASMATGATGRCSGRQQAALVGILRASHYGAGYRGR